MRFLVGIHKNMENIEFFMLRLNFTEYESRI